MFLLILLLLDEKKIEFVVRGQKIYPSGSSLLRATAVYKLIERLLLFGFRWPVCCHGICC